MTIVDIAYEQLKSLPDPQVRQVLDFIGYLKQRSERADWEDLMNAQACSLGDVWDNPEDEVWNEL